LQALADAKGGEKNPLTLSGREERPSRRSFKGGRENCTGTVGGGVTAAAGRMEKGGGKPLLRFGRHWGEGRRHEAAIGLLGEKEGGNGAA